MEKICIVKLRKKIGPALCPAKVFRGDTGPVEGEDHDGADGTADAADAAIDSQNAPPRAISLTLTPEQSGTLRANPRLMSSLIEQPDERSKAARLPVESLVIKLTFEAATPVRLLKIADVVRMLRIGKSLIRKLIKQGHLKGYRIGRLRRILLDDVLSYLEANRDPTGSLTQPEALKAKTADTAFG